MPKTKAASPPPAPPLLHELHEEIRRQLGDHLNAANAQSGTDRIGWHIEQAHRLAQTLEIIDNLMCRVIPD
jgi:alkylated DNA repair dioxygenase AlkB